MRRLQFGTGPNVLPAPWENFDQEIDIRRPLPFPDACAQVILAEHVIEHVEFRQGLFFLTECFRVLLPGGILRLAFPDITRDINCDEYRTSFAEQYKRPLPEEHDVWYSILCDWGHKSCWTNHMARRVLLTIGFCRSRPRPCGYTEITEFAGCCDRIPRSETTALEAIKGI